MPRRSKKGFILCLFVLLALSAPVHGVARKPQADDSQIPAVSVYVGTQRVNTVRQYLMAIGKEQGLVIEKIDAKGALLERVITWGDKTQVEIDRNGTGHLDEWQAFSDNAHISMGRPEGGHFTTMSVQVLLPKSRVTMEFSRDRNERFQLISRAESPLEPMWSETKSEVGGRGTRQTSETKPVELSKAKLGPAIDALVRNQNLCSEGAFKAKGRTSEFRKVTSAISSVVTSDSASAQAVTQNAGSSSPLYLGCMRSYGMDATASYIQAQFHNPAEIAGGNPTPSWSINCQTCDGFSGTGADLCNNPPKNGAFVPGAIKGGTGGGSVSFVKSSGCARTNSCTSSESQYARTFLHEMLHKAFYQSDIEVNSILNCCAPAEGQEANCSGMTALGANVQVAAVRPAVSLNSPSVARQAAIAVSAGGKSSLAANTATSGAVQSTQSSAGATGNQQSSIFKSSAQKSAAMEICTKLLSTSKTVGNCISDYLTHLEENCAKVSSGGCSALDKAQIGSVETKTLDSFVDHRCVGDKDACNVGKEELARVLAPDSTLAKKNIDISKLPASDQWLKSTEQPLSTDGKLNYHNLGAVGGSPTTGNIRAAALSSAAPSGAGQRGTSSMRSENRLGGGGGSFAANAGEVAGVLHQMMEIAQNSDEASQRAVSVPDPSAASNRALVASLENLANSASRESTSANVAGPTALGKNSSAPSTEAGSVASLLERGKTLSEPDGPAPIKRAPAAANIDGAGKKLSSSKVFGMSPAAAAVRTKAKASDPKARHDFIRQMTLLDRDEMQLALSDEEVQNSLEVYVIGVLDDTGERRDQALNPSDWLIYNHRTEHLVYKEGSLKK